MGGGTFIRPPGMGSAGGDRLAQQRIAVLEQDVMIDEIANGVDRLHDRALMINEETTLHKNLLDDMDMDVDKATAGLRQETKHAKKVRRATTASIQIPARVTMGITLLPVAGARVDDELLHVYLHSGPPRDVGATYCD